MSCAPFINQIRLTDEQFIILACDGLWDVIDDQRASELVVKDKQVQGNYKRSAAVLRDAAFQLGSGDNISVIVVGLQNVL